VALGQVAGRVREINELGSEGKEALDVSEVRREAQRRPDGAAEGSPIARV
jgi:hypothetical protein